MLHPRHTNSITCTRNEQEGVAKSRGVRHPFLETSQESITQAVNPPPNLQHLLEQVIQHLNIPSMRKVLQKRGGFENDSSKICAAQQPGLMVFPLRLQPLCTRAVGIPHFFSNHIDTDGCPYPRLAASHWECVTNAKLCKTTLHTLQMQHRLQTQCQPQTSCMSMLTRF